MFDGPSKKQKRQEEEDNFEDSDDALNYGDDVSDDDDEEEEEEERPAKATKKSSKKQQQDSDAEQGDEEEEGDDGWWGGKKDFYGADEINAEEQALEEEKEAMRLLKRKRAKMTESDFIESEWLAPDAKDENEDREVVTEVLKDMEIPADMSEHDRLRLLQSRYPELEYLADELLALQPQLVSLQQAAEGQPPRSLAVVKYRVCGAYVATLGMYFALLTSPARDSEGVTKALDPSELREHEVMTYLFQTREAWQRAKDLQSNAVVEEKPSDEDAMSVDDAVGVIEAPSKKTSKSAEKKKSKKAEREAKELEASLADLDALLISKKPKKKMARAEAAADDNSDFGEEEVMGEAEAQEKAKRKKSLRFYTSQIVQKANNRADHSRLAGGDDDVPIKERLRDRRNRLNAEAEKRGLKGSKLGADLGDESDDETKQQAKALRNEEDEYYDMVAQKSKQKKSDKVARKDALANAGKADRVVEKEEVGPDGRRIISYQIEKNKGLAPHRKKEVRNPRLKKRLKVRSAPIPSIPIFRWRTLLLITFCNLVRGGQEEVEESKGRVQRRRGPRRIRRRGDRYQGGLGQEHQAIDHTCVSMDLTNILAEISQGFWIQRIFSRICRAVHIMPCLPKASDRSPTF